MTIFENFAFGHFILVKKVEAPHLAGQQKIFFVWQPKNNCLQNCVFFGGKIVTKIAYFLVKFFDKNSHYYMLRI